MAKTLGRSAQRALTIEKAGTEPVWSGIATDAQFGDYLNWCSVIYDFAETRDFFEKYLEENKFKVSALKNLSDERFGTVGAIARALSYGRLFDAGVMARFNAKIKSLYAMAKDTSPVVAKKTVVQYIEAKVEDGIIYAERLLDRVFTELELNDDMKLSLANGAINQKVAEMYLPILQKNIDEIDVAISGKDPEIAEGYADWDRNKLKQLANVLDDFKDEIVKISETTTKRVSKPRKVRVSRPKSPEKQIKKLNYAKTDDKYKLKSIEPRTIVGANELWVFNTTYVKLTVFRAEDRGGLTVKGSTICGFDTSKSSVRRLRKPEVTLPIVLNDGKVAVRNAMDTLTTKPATPKGRISKDTILLRVFK